MTAGLLEPRDAWREGNTGFHLFRTNARTQRLLRRTLELTSRHPGLDDQSLLWQVLRARYRDGQATFARVLSNGFSSGPPTWNATVKGSPLSSSPTIGTLRKSSEIGEARAPRRELISYCMLPRHTHVNGQCFGGSRNKQPRIQFPDAVIIHANWLSGPKRKVAKLKRADLWALPPHPGRIFESTDAKASVCPSWPPAAESRRDWLHDWILWLNSFLFFRRQLVVERMY